MSEGQPSFLDRVVTLPSRVLVAIVRGYQLTISPAIPALFGSTAGCRFAPTCSHYAVEALKTRGAMVGTALTLWRLVRCTPLHPGGNDPVPLKRVPRCTRVTA